MLKVATALQIGTINRLLRRTFGIVLPSACPQRLEFAYVFDDGGW